MTARKPAVFKKPSQPVQPDKEIQNDEAEVEEKMDVSKEAGEKGYDPVSWLAMKEEKKPQHRQTPRYLYLYMKYW